MKTSDSRPDINKKVTRMAKDPICGMTVKHSPIIAGTAMSLSSVSVITNALRLRRVKL